eukprot:g19227.t1
MFSQVHFNATDIAAENAGAVLDPMAAAEEQMKTEEDRKRQGGALGPDAKRQRVTADAQTARKELLGKFEPAETWEGIRDGFIFKLGIKGLGYYEEGLADSSLQQIEARSAAAAAAERKALAAEQRAQEANPEEIELDMDDDEDDAPGAEPPPAASSSAAVAMTANSEEIELNVEDIEEAPIPSEVFGGGLSSMRANLPDWAGAHCLWGGTGGVHVGGGEVQTGHH